MPVAAIRFAFALFALALAFGGVRGVSAHAHYDHSTPAIGQVLAAGPERVDIYTDQDMAKVSGGNSIQVADASGQRVDAGAAVVDGADRRHFSVALKPNLLACRYVVSFTTVSDVDGDKDHGRFAFYVGNGPTAAQKAEDARLTSAAPAASSTSRSRTVLYAGIGGACLLVLAAAVAVYAVRRRRLGR